MLVGRPFSLQANEDSVWARITRIIHIGCCKVMVASHESIDWILEFYRFNSLAKKHFYFQIQSPKLSF